MSVKLSDLFLTGIGSFSITNSDYSEVWSCPIGQYHYKLTSICTWMGDQMLSISLVLTCETANAQVLANCVGCVS